MMKSLSYTYKITSDYIIFLNSSNYFMTDLNVRSHKTFKFSVYLDENVKLSQLYYSFLVTATNIIELDI